MLEEVAIKLHPQNKTDATSLFLGLRALLGQHVCLVSPVFLASHLIAVSRVRPKKANCTLAVGENCTERPCEEKFHKKLY